MQALAGRAPDRSEAGPCPREGSFGALAERVVGMTPARLLGDVGGTNARFAWQDTDGAPLRDVVSIPTADHPTLAAALAAYLRSVGQAAPPWCAIGIANPVTGDHVQMTNSPWSFSIEAVRRELGFERLVVVNDFTALALALPDLAPGELRQLGGGAAVAAAPLALIGPGTGLGVSGLVPTGEPGRWVALQGEGGHVTLEIRRRSRPSVPTATATSSRPSWPCSMVTTGLPCRPLPRSGPRRPPRRDAMTPADSRRTGRARPPTPR